MAENKILSALAREFLKTDSARKSGRGNPASMAIKDRINEGKLMAGLMGPLAPLGTVPVGLAGAIYEGVKYAGQKTGLGKHLPGPFKVGKNTSPASGHNILALMKGFTEQATGQGRKSGAAVKKLKHQDIARRFLMNQIQQEVNNKTEIPDVGTD